MIDIQRTIEGETVNGLPVVAYMACKPTGFSPPSSTTYPYIAGWHWSTPGKNEVVSKLFHERDVYVLMEENEDLKYTLRNTHLSYCNNWNNPIGNSGCMCKVVNKYRAEDNEMMRQRDDWIKKSIELVDALNAVVHAEKGDVFTNIKLYNQLQNAVNAVDVETVRKNVGLVNG